MNRFQIVLTVLCLAANAASAEPVMLRGSELGQGFTFSHRGNCYVVFPQHVTSRRTRLQVVAEGAVTGFASPRFPFWPGIDLAVGSVARDAARRCTRTIDDLEPPARALSPSGRGNLVLVDVEGNVTRLPMRITRIDYLEFEATFETAGTTAAIQGMSGAFLFVDDRPVGMALETTDAGGIRFMRIEELHMNLSRWLGTQRAVGFSDTTAADPPAQQTDDSLKLTVLSASATATGPETMVENVLLDSGYYLFEPKGQPHIDFFVGDPEQKSTVSRVRLRADPDAGQAVPRRVVVLINASEKGGRWRRFWSGEMPPTGTIDSGPLAPVWAKQVRLIIADAWSPGPVRLDRVALE